MKPLTVAAYKQQTEDDDFEENDHQTLILLYKYVFTAKDFHRAYGKEKE